MDPKLQEVVAHPALLRRYHLPSRQVSQMGNRAKSPGTADDGARIEFLWLSPMQRVAVLAIIGLLAAEVYMFEL